MVYNECIQSGEEKKLIRRVKIRGNVGMFDSSLFHNSNRLSSTQFITTFYYVEHPNFLGCRTTFLRFELSNKVQSNIPPVAKITLTNGKI